jgi:transposase-like protein
LSETAVELVVAHAPETPVRDLRDAWLRVLAGALSSADSVAAAADKLGLSVRTLWEWLRRLDEEHPALAAKLPERRPAGGPTAAAVKGFVAREKLDAGPTRKKVRKSAKNA